MYTNNKVVVTSVYRDLLFIPTMFKAWNKRKRVKEEKKKGSILNGQ